MSPSPLNFSQGTENGMVALKKAKLHILLNVEDKENDLADTRSQTIYPDCNVFANH